MRAFAGFAAGCAIGVAVSFGSARASAQVAGGELVPTVWVDSCPFDPRRPHAMRCFAQRLVPEESIRARAIGPFTASPDAGEGVDASSEIFACDGEIAVGSGRSPFGLGPADYVSAYGIPTSARGGGKIVAVVDSCANTTIVSDLAAYRAGFGLPPLPTCGGGPGHAPIAGGPPCFGVLSQRGDGVLPTPDSGWAGEIALDVEMVSVGCPDCSILLVEADSPNYWDAAPAVNEAVALGASAVSNSYGSPEDPNDPFGSAYSDGPYAAAYVHPGVLIAVASGDWGYEDEALSSPGDAVFAPSFPATVPSVLSVGGTYLSGSPSHGYGETVWSQTSSGCSGEFGKPAYQSSIDMGGCAKRGDVDLAAAAVNVAAYVGGGWADFKGTSCAAPFVAGLLTRLGLATQPNDFFYANGGAFFDISEGANAQNCTSVMCQAKPGWDGPSGLGSPNAAVLSMIDAGPPAGEGDDAGVDSGLVNDAGSPSSLADANLPVDASGLSRGGLSDAGPVDDAATGAPGDDGGAGAQAASKNCGCAVIGASNEGAPARMSLVALAAFGALLRVRRRPLRLLAPPRA